MKFSTNDDKYVSKFDNDIESGWGMKFKKSCQAYVGEFEDGQESGFGYCSRNLEEYEVKEQKITTLKVEKAIIITSVT